MPVQIVANVSSGMFAATREPAGPALAVPHLTPESANTGKVAPGGAGAKREWWEGLLQTGWMFWGRREGNEGRIGHRKKWNW